MQKNARTDTNFLAISKNLKSNRMATRGRVTKVSLEAEDRISTIFRIRRRWLNNVCKMLELTRGNRFNRACAATPGRNDEKRRAFGNRGINWVASAV